MSRGFTLHCRRAAALVGITASLFAAPRLLFAAPPSERVTLAGHLPTRALAAARHLGRVAAAEPISLALALPLRDQATLTDLLERLYDPNDEIYGMYLTRDEFTARFGPTREDYQAVIDYTVAQGLTVTQTHPNRLILDVAGPAQNVEKAFGVQLHRFLAPEGRVFRAPDREPAVPSAIAARLQGVVGLDTAGVWHNHSKVRAADPLDLFMPDGTGSGVYGGLTPSDIKAAYNLKNTTLTGSGQTLALFELDGYAAKDVTAYESAFGLPNVPLTNVLVDGVTGSTNTDGVEVTLDIELEIALAPGVSKLYVYEGPNTGQGVIDTYQKIANDNVAKSISTSWGQDEPSATHYFITLESAIFQQMAAQGQSLFAASGDSGAYDNGSTLTVDDPASQPYVTGVGGTSLTTNGPGGAWKSETVWNNGYKGRDSGGGGISVLWPIPSYQSQLGVISTASLGSTTKRNVPDVSLDADPYTGYSIYYQNGWSVYGGTSCAVPLWAAFTTLVNQQRALNGKGTLGFANPPIYTVGLGADYGSDFHDINDGRTNLYYPTVKGYDLATGWGSFNGLNLLNDLAGVAQATNLIGNPGFENGPANIAPWSATAGVSFNSGEPPHSGFYAARLDGTGTTQSQYIYQTVTIPAAITKATLSFYLHIDTQETTKTAANDHLYVQLRNSSGSTQLTQLASYSNLNAAAGYTQQTFDVSAYKGQTVLLVLVGTENNSLATSFVLDDFSLIAQ